MVQKKKIFSLIIFISGLFLGCLFGFFSSYIINKQESQQNILAKNIIKIDNKIWTSADLPNDLLLEYSNIENNIYNAQKRFADHLALRILLAKEQNKSFDNKYIPGIFELIKVKEITDNEIHDYYNKIIKEHGVNVFAGQSFEKIKPQIKYQLNYERLNNIAEKKIDQLLLENKYKTYYYNPLGNPILFDINKYPKRGNSEANYSLVSVLDFNDPKSIELENKLDKIYQKYSKKVNFINIPYSANFHAPSGYFAKGAYCAQEQGNEKYWDYYKRSFEKKIKSNHENANNNEIKNMVLEVANSANLNINNFNDCLESKKISDTLLSVQNQLYSTSGFKGAPALYLNKRSVNISLSELESVLNKELH